MRSRRARRVYYTTSLEYETEIESGGCAQVYMWLLRVACHRLLTTLYIPHLQPRSPPRPFSSPPISLVPPLRYILGRRRHRWARDMMISICVASPAHNTIYTSPAASVTAPPILLPADIACPSPAVYPRPPPSQVGSRSDDIYMCGIDCSQHYIYIYLTSSLGHRPARSPPRRYLGPSSFRATSPTCKL